MRDKNSSKGFTLLEIIISLAVLVVGVISLVSMFGSGFSMAGISEQSSTAVFLAQERMEQLRNETYANIINEARSATGFAFFDREVVISYPESPDTDIKQVTVTVYWTVKSGEGKIELVSYFVNL